MDIPDYKMVQGGNTRVNMRSTYMGQDASKIGKAFASMGKDLESAGMQVSGIFEEAEKQHNAGKMADLQLELDQTMSSYQEKMMSDPNNAINWRGDFDKVLQAKENELSKRDMSRNLRDQTQAYFKNFRGKSGISVSHTAHKTILTNASKSVEVRVADLRARGLYAEAANLVKESVPRGIMPTHRGEELMLSMERDEILREYDNQLEADPEGFAQRLEEGKIQGSHEDLKAYENKAKRIVSVRKTENIDKIRNSINGLRVKDTSELNTLMDEAGFDDTERVAMLSYYDTRSDAAIKAYDAEPVQQERLVGRFQSQLANYNPTGDKSDTGYAEIMATVDRISPSRERDEMIKELDAKRAGGEAVKAKTEQHLNDTIKRQGELRIAKHKEKEPKAIKRTVDSYLKDGFLNSARNLTPYFHEQKVIDSILNAKTDKDKIKAFRDAYKNGQKYQGFTKWQQEMGWALDSGRFSSVISTYEDKEAGEKWQKELAQIETQNGKVGLDILKRTLNGEFKETKVEEMDKIGAGASLFNDPKTHFDSLSPIAAIKNPTSKYEARFADTYSKYAEANGLDKNPDSYKHYYDYRGAYNEMGLRTDEEGHLPSKFKREGHPRLYRSQDGKSFSPDAKLGWTDTRDDSIVGAKAGAKPIDAPYEFDKLKSNPKEEELDSEGDRAYKESLRRAAEDTDTILPLHPKKQEKLNELLKGLSEDELAQLKAQLQES